MLGILRGFHIGFTVMLASMALIMCVVVYLYAASLDVGGIASQQELDVTALVTAFFLVVAIFSLLGTWAWLKRKIMPALILSAISYSVFCTGVWAWTAFDAPTMEKAGCRLISDGPCPRVD